MSDGVIRAKPQKGNSSKQLGWKLGVFSIKVEYKMVDGTTRKLMIIVGLKGVMWG